MIGSPTLASARQSRSSSVPAAWPVASVIERLMPRIVAGIRADARAASEEVIPGRTRNGMPALARASASSDRKRVVEGTRVSVSVDLGGRRILKKKQQKN